MMLERQREGIAKDNAAWRSIPPRSERWSALRPWIQQSRYFLLPTIGSRGLPPLRRL
jgi:hypothetical protein